MTQIGVPTLLSHMRRTSAVGGLRQQAETSRTEVVTGRKADLPRVLGAGLFDAQLLRSAIDSGALHREAISRIIIRADVAQRALDEVSSGASQLNAELLAALGRGDEAAISVSSTDARSRIETAFARLNVRVGGLSIFAGDAADQNALSSADQLLSDIVTIYARAASAAQFETDLDAYFNDPAGGFATSIFNGGAGDLGSLEIANGELASGTAKADEPAIKDLLRGLAVIAVAGDSPQSAFRDAALANAGSRALNGADGIVFARQYWDFLFAVWLVLAAALGAATWARARRKRRDDLDRFAGTLSEADAREFEGSLRKQRKVDRELWT